MKRLLKYLSPFAPDQSGAVSALFEFGGVMVICDAGGCTGNICGFDEPRWFTSRSALFSACLRNMDAVMGRDDKLIKRLADACEIIQPPFTVLIGTPVPAVIATDFRALQRMAEKATGIPCLPIPTTGTRPYANGVEEAFLALFKQFATETYPVEPGLTGYLGATPLDMSVCGLPKTEGAVYYGMGSSLEDVKRASRAERNIVLSPSGKPVAEYLQQKFGTPYKFAFPFLPPLEIPDGVEHVLIVHQQVAANALRDKLKTTGKPVTVGSFFSMLPELKSAGDVFVQSEEQFAEVAKDYDCIIADSMLRHALPTWHGIWLEFTHFAVSGRLRK